MTNLRDRPNTALLVVDVQNGVVANAHHRDEVISNIDTLIDKARSERAPVGGRRSQDLDNNGSLFRLDLCRCPH